jgi:hypothetical protein
MHAGWRVATVFAFLCGSIATRAQLPPQSVRADAQQRTDREAIAEAQKAELILAGRLGALRRDALAAMIPWSRAAAAWKSESHPGAGSHLASGVVMDCLSRIRDVKTPLFADDPMTPFPSDLAGQRAKRAADEFDAAVKAEPSLIEARLRRARIRAPKNRSAIAELELIANEGNEYPFSYIAAISRAEIAQAAHDDAAVESWYRRALVLYPQSAAAAIGLSTLSRSPALPLASAGSRDLYYEYPCTVLTPAVATALAGRLASIQKR